jgi:hypothetical protein
VFSKENAFDYHQPRRIAMPYLITTCWFPSDKSMEVAEKELEALKRFPPDESLGNRVVPVAVKATKQGVEAISILEVKEGKLEEAFSRAINGMAMYQNIVGFEHSIQIYSTASEAMAVFGMNYPE